MSGPAASGIAPIIGPFVGGLLVDELSWRWIFIINVPLIVVALWAAQRHIKESRDETASDDFDWIGALLVGLAVGGLSFGAIYGQQRQWQDPIAFVALAHRGTVAISLPFYFHRARNPLVPLSMFRSRNFSVTNLSTLLIYGALYVQLLFVVGLHAGHARLHRGRGWPGAIPGPLFLIFLSTRFGALASRFGPRIFMTVGPALMAVGHALAGSHPGRQRALAVEHRRPEQPTCRRPTTWSTSCPARSSSASGCRSWSRH